jgi:hypothetical protein
VITGYTGSISVLTHTDTYAGDKPWSRFWTICAGFAIASLGAGIINWGGLASINFGSLTVDLKAVSVVGGVIGGLFNIDKPSS